MKTNYVITIGRQLGSGGKALGELLSQKLSIPCYDKELILMASRESGLEQELFEKADEKNNRSFLSFLLAGNHDVTGNYLSNEILFKIQSDVIKKIAEKESCVFVGRCADYILRAHENLLSIFVSANLNDRIKIISKNNNISASEAQNLIAQTDKKRAEYYNYFSNKTWGMATSYDLCFNASVVSIKKMATFICEQINEKEI